MGPRTLCRRWTVGPRLRIRPVDLTTKSSVLLIIVNERDEVTTDKIARRQFDTGEFLIITRFRKELHDLNEAGHVHHSMVCSEGEAEAIFGERSLKEKDSPWFYSVARSIWKGMGWGYSVLIKHSQRKFGLSKAL